MYRSFIKRFFDFSVSLLAIACLSPLMVIIGVVLLIANRGTPFFMQERPGKNAKFFKIIKFRTMNDFRDDNGKLLPDAVRLTTVGAFIRKTSLDELPQLINVLKGDMSLIGPRPLLTEYLCLYSKEEAKRHNVRPGITGWAQVNGRNAISWTKKFEYDIWYVNNISLVLDLRIIILTFKKVIAREGITSNTSVTIEKFTGS